MLAVTKFQLYLRNITGFMWVWEISKFEFLWRDQLDDIDKCPRPTNAIAVRSSQLLRKRYSPGYNSDSYQNCSCEISIPLDCFVVKDYLLSNCSDRTAMALVGQGPGPWWTICAQGFSVQASVVRQTWNRIAFFHRQSCSPTRQRLLWLQMWHFTYIHDYQYIKYGAQPPQ